MFEVLEGKLMLMSPRGTKCYGSLLPLLLLLIIWRQEILIDWLGGRTAAAGESEL